MWGISLFVGQWTLGFLETLLLLILQQGKVPCNDDIVMLAAGSSRRRMYNLW
jgi:hypothetical protein